MITMTPEIVNTHNNACQSSLQKIRSGGHLRTWERGKGERERVQVRAVQRPGNTRKTEAGPASIPRRVPQFLDRLVQGLCLALWARAEPELDIPPPGPPPTVVSEN